MLSEHQRRVNQTDSFKPERETPPESQEFQVNLAELYVEFSEVADVVQEKPLAEVGFDELVLECVFCTSHDKLKCVESNLVLLNI